MAPTLRSSAPNTPNSKYPGGKDPSSVTPRKAPTCTKCKRPKSGHPRSGCPYTESQHSITDQYSPAENASHSIIEDLGSMHLHSPSRGADEDTRVTIRQRRRSSLAAALANTQSVVSLDAEAHEIMDSLIQPALTRSTDKRIKMPGSLSSPSPYSSQESIKIENPASTATIDNTNNDHVMAPIPSPTPSPSIPAVQQLNRSMSMEQREAFLSSLNNTSGATVYLVPRDNIHNTQTDAIKVGFFTRVVLGKDPSDSQGLLVLGRNEAAVKHLYQQLEMEHKESNSFRAATAGAVVGAVGAFAGLAFT